MTLSEYQTQAHKIAREKGWWDSELTPEFLITKLSLIMCECAEAIECIRSGQMDYVLEEGKPEGLPVELADVFIRLVDLCEALDIDLETTVLSKMLYNKTRAYRHGGKQA